ncbi:MAG TPA: hypothetical protein DCY20_02385 [Firmicutes bacterium]|nr:hypothetical protein [Bacillota bacterium]
MLISSKCQIEKGDVLQMVPYRIKLKTKLTKLNHQFVLMIKMIYLNLNSILLFEVIHKGIGFFILLPLLNQLIHLSLHLRFMTYLDLNVLKTYIHYPKSLFIMIIATLLFILWMGIEYIFLLSCFANNGSDVVTIWSRSKQKAVEFWKYRKGKLIKTMLAYLVVFMIIYLVTIHTNLIVFRLAFNVIKQNGAIFWAVCFITILLLWGIARWLYLIGDISEKQIASQQFLKTWQRQISIKTVLFCLLLLLFFSLLVFLFNVLTTVFVYFIRFDIYYTAIIGIKTFVRRLYSGLLFILVPPLVLAFMSADLILMKPSIHSSVGVKKNTGITKGTMICVAMFLLAYFSTLLYDTHDFFTFVPKELKQPLAIAHRGTSLWAPGNSLSSITEAIEAEADYIELDVQVSSDGVPVLFHDRYLSSFNTNSTDYHLNRLRINEVPYDELQQLTLKTYFPDIYKESIVTLTEALDKINEKAGLMLEIKTDNQDEIQIILKTLLESGFNSPLYISSFDIQTLTFFKQSSLNCQTNLLLTGFVGEIDTILTNPDIDALAFEYAAIHSLLVDQIHTANKMIFVWTLNEPEKMVRTIYDGVDGIITDDPTIVKNNFYHITNSEFVQLFNVIAN